MRPAGHRGDVRHLAKCHPDDPEASLEIAELARSLSDDTTGTVAEHGVWRAWQRSAAEYAARANRLLASLPASPPEGQQEGFAALDLAESALSDIERRLDAADPGVLLRRSTRGAQPTAADLRRRLPEGTLLLEYLAVGDDLLGWAVTRDGARSDRQQLPTRELAAMVRDLHRSCAEGRARETHLAALLLAPHADLLRACDRVVVVPFGPLTMVPFHALRFDDAPLGLSNVVSYAPRAAHLAEDRPPDSPVTLRRSLVVGDPAFETAAHPTLVELPGARVEAVAVGAALGAPADDVLVGAAATEAAVGARLEDCDVLHLSTHGRLDELAPFASSLVLAGRDELTVADIAGLRFGTDLAVLSGCDTGRGAATLGGDLIGLTRSLLRSGVRRTVVSLWPVDDDVAPVLMQAFYPSLAAGRPCAHALADAQRQVAGMTRADLRAAYEALGGTPEGYRAVRHRGARRGPVGLELDAELRDDEEVPEPLGGDAERYWAPFVLVG